MTTVALSSDRRRRRSTALQQGLERRITAIWVLLLLNGLPWIGLTILPLPQALGQVMAMGALVGAGLLALSLNRRLLLRPNLVLALLLLFAATALISSVRGTAGLGAVVRSFRLIGFLTVLWLLTPWWGRRDLLLARCHLRALLGVSATVVAGLLIAPSAALALDGRLSGIIWPVWPTAVAHISAVVAGMGTVLWLSRTMATRRALLLVAGGVSLLLLTQTRTALLALVAGVLCAAATLFVARRRVRNAVSVVLVLAPIAAVALAPALSTWFVRGQSTEELTGLTGRRHVWEMLLNAPRSEFEQWFGSGFSDRGFAGLPIDNAWLSIYNDQGILGVSIIAAVVLYLLVAPTFRPPSTERALATFLVVYCVTESVTEVGLGDASPYLLSLTVAASLLAPRIGTVVNPPENLRPLP